MNLLMNGWGIYQILLNSFDDLIYYFAKKIVQKIVLVLNVK